MQKTHPSVSQEYTHLEDTLGKIPLMLYQTFPFTQWLNNTSKPVTHHPLFHLSGNLSTWVAIIGFGCRMLLFLFMVLSLCVITLKQLHHRELIWSQWCSAHTQTFESQPMGFSEDSEVYSNNSISKTFRQQERHVDIKCFMCQEETVISAGSTCIRKLKWNIMKSERIRILYKSVFCFIILQATAGIYHITQMENQILKEQRDLIQLWKWQIAIWILLFWKLEHFHYSIWYNLISIPEISIWTKFFIPKRRAVFPLSSRLSQPSILQWILLHYEDSPSLQGEGIKRQVK